MKKIKAILEVIGSVIVAIGLVFFYFFTGKKAGDTQGNKTPEDILNGMEKDDEKINNLNKQAEGLNDQRKKLLDDINSGNVPRQ